jgi:hypothetical protein
MKIELTGEIIDIVDLRPLSDGKKSVYTILLRCTETRINAFGGNVIANIYDFPITCFTDMLEYDKSLIGLELRCYCELSGKRVKNKEDKLFSVIDLRLLEHTFDV